MMILYDRRIRASLSWFRRAQIWAVERLMYVNCGSGDIRWAIMALAVRSCATLWASGQKRLLLRLRKLADRLAAEGSDADSMVAAGGG